MQCNLESLVSLLYYLDNFNHFGVFTPANTLSPAAPPPASPRCTYCNVRCDVVCRDVCHRRIVRSSVSQSTHRPTLRLALSCRPLRRLPPQRPPPPCHAVRRMCVHAIRCNSFRHRAVRPSALHCRVTRCDGCRGAVSSVATAAATVAAVSYVARITEAAGIVRTSRRCRAASEPNRRCRAGCGSAAVPRNGYALPSVGAGAGAPLSVATATTLVASGPCCCDLQ